MVGRKRKTAIKPEAEAEVIKPEAEAEVIEPARTKVWRVKDGCAITSKKGILTSGVEVTVDHFSDQAAMDKLKDTHLVYE